MHMARQSPTGSSLETSKGFKYMSSVYEVINPATEKVVTAIELADEAATDAAIELSLIHI